LYTAFGETPHLATQLQQLAAPGTLLISEATYRLVQAEVRVEPWSIGDRAAGSLPVAVYTVRGVISPQEGGANAAHGR
jgi:class 3 adenylate cyclase